MRHKNGGLEGLKPIKPVPKEAKQGIDSKIERRIITLKQKYPHCGARRIKNQFREL